MITQRGALCYICQMSERVWIICPACGGDISVWPCEFCNCVGEVDLCIGACADLDEEPPDA